MRGARGRYKAVAGLCTALLLGTALAGCSSGGSKSSSSASGGGQVTITLGLFGTFGYKESGLIDEYMKEHPNIKIVEHDTEKEETYWPALQTHLAAGAGTDDIQGIEVGRIADVVQNESSKWTDLNTLGATSETPDYLPWKAQAGTTKDGKVLGLGTDVGPMAICYRSDLLAAAGLPTDPTTLAQMWSTWQGYIDTGKQYQAKAPAGTHWTDSVTGMYNAQIGQDQESYYDAGGTPVYDSNPAVKQAWDLSTQAAQAGLSAKLTQFQDDWNQAFAKGAFATVSCPSWMLGYIKTQAGDASSGKWNVAAAPGGTGNWGGSYLGIPKASKHQKEAYALLQWLTAPAQQVTLFQKEGNFPSRLSAIAQVKDTTNAYFSNAPTGQIFSDSAQKMPVAILGVHDNDFKNNYQNGLISVEAQGVKPDDAWSQANAANKNILNS